jgi:acetyltransferase
MEQTRIFTALNGVRGRPPVDIDTLERILVRFSRLVVEQPWIKEIDINPLLASANGILALDARIVTYAAETALERLPKSAIRPYPTQYVRGWKTKIGTSVLIRPIRPEDEPLMVKFHQSLSSASVFLRYFHMVSVDERVAHTRLIRQCFIDYDREMALVADVQKAGSDEHEIVAVARLTKMRGELEAEVAVVVTDTYQGKGLGTELVRQLIAIGRDEKLERIVARILPENEAMHALARRLNFRFETSSELDSLTAVLDVQRVPSSCETAHNAA